MLNGRFRFDEPAAQITGVIDPRGVYHVVTGHHRMAAAIDIYKRSGDLSFVRELIDRGHWVTITYIPHESRPLPALDWWGRFRNWLGW